MADRGTTGYLDDFRARGGAIAEACTRCGACFRACPMVAPAGLAEADPKETAAGIIDLITGGEGSAAAVSWASVCSGSGNCIPACPEGINTRFMVPLARGFARAQARRAAPHALAAGLSDDEPRGAGPVTAAIAARDISAGQGAIRGGGAPKPARCRLLHRMQHLEDPAHRPPLSPTA